MLSQHFVQLTGHYRVSFITQTVYFLNLIVKCLAKQVVKTTSFIKKRKFVQAAH